MLWKYPFTFEDVFGTCDLISLPPGMVISRDPQMVSLIGEGSQYQAECARQMLVLSSLNGELENNGINRLPLLQLGWDYNINTDYQFIYTIYPIVYSLSCCTFITAFLCIIIYTKLYMKSQRPTKLIKWSSLLAFLFLLSIYILAIVKLYDQHNTNISSGDLLVSIIQDSVLCNVCELIIVMLLQFSQIQIIMRLFPRQKEKRFAFFVGIALSVTSQTIWSVSTFALENELLDLDPNYDSAFVILPLFVYLLRIAMSVLFTCLFVVYFLNKRQFIFQPSVLPLTFFTFILMNSSFAIFIADISNIWVSELSELFNMTSYVVTNVVTWEFINRIILLEKVEQKKGILGRQCFDDEDQYYFDAFGNTVNRNRVIRKGKYDLIISSHDKDSHQNESSISSSNTKVSTILTNTVAAEKSSRWRHFKQTFTDLTDYLVDISFSAPLPKDSSPSDTSSLYSTELPRTNIIQDYISKKLHKKQEEQSEPPQQRVYLYKPREFKSGRKTMKSTHQHAQVRFNIPQIDEEVSEIATQFSQEEEIIYDDGSYDFDDDNDNDNDSDL